MDSIRGKKMFSYLSWYYDRSRIMQSVIDSQGIEIDAARLTLEEILKQFYVDTATWGLELWEKELAISPPADAKVEMRRALINAKLLMSEIMTPELIEAMANCFVPAKDARVIEIPKSYVFDIHFPSFVPADLAMEMYKVIYKAKPAHLGTKYQFQSQIIQKLSHVGATHTTISIATYPAKQYIAPKILSFNLSSAAHIAFRLKTYPMIPKKIQVTKPLNIISAHHSTMHIITYPRLDRPNI